MSNSSGTDFARGLRQGDPGPLWDEMVGGNDTEQCASELLDPSSIRFACLSNCVWRQGAGAGSTYARGYRFTHIASAHTSPTPLYQLATLQTETH